MKTKTIKLADGTEVEVPAEVADVLESRADAVSVTIGDTKYSVHPAVAAALEDAKKGKPAFMEPDKDKDKDEDKDGDGKSKDDASALRAKVDTLEARATEDAATFNARVDARSRLVSDARTVLGADHKVDGVGDEELMVAIVLDVLPSMRERLAANKNDAGYLRCAYEQAMAHHQRGDEAVRDTNETVFHAINDGGGDVLEDALRFYDARADRAMAAGE